MTCIQPLLELETQLWLNPVKLKMSIVTPAVAAQLVEQLTRDPRFKSSNLAAACIGKK